MSDGLDQAMDTINNLSDLQVFANMIAGIVADAVTKQLGSTYFKIFGTVISALISAIAYMYLTQKSERKRAEDEKKQANDRLFAVLGESTRLMETVKNGLKDSAASEKKSRKALEKMIVIVRGCELRDKRLDDSGLDEIMDIGDNDD